MVLLDSDPYPTFKGLEIFQRKREREREREREKRKTRKEDENHTKPKQSKSNRKGRDCGTAMNKTFQFIKPYISKFDVLILTSNQSIWLDD